MPTYNLKYLHLYIYKVVEGKAITLLEEMTSYHPTYKVGDELSFLVTEEHNVKNKPHILETHVIKEIKDIVAVDKTGKYPSEHTLVIRVSQDDVAIQDLENENEEEEESEITVMDFFLSRINPN